MAKRLDWFYTRRGCTACGKAEAFLADHGIEATEVVPASRKLGRDEALEFAKAARRVVVAKGKRVEEFRPGAGADEDLLRGMLGPTGNLRAPLLRVGKAVLVGFDEDSYRDVLL